MPPHNSGFSEKHLSNFLQGKSTIVYFQSGGGGVGGVISPQYDPEFIENHRQNFSTMEKHTQLEMLYIYLKDRATEDNIYTKEGDRVIGDYFNCGKDLINKRFKELISIGWISELTELNRKYKLLREDK